MRRLVMIGASGHGKVCAEIAELSGIYEDILFLDDDPGVEECGEYKVYGTSDDIKEYVNDETDFFVSIGNIAHRKSIQGKVERSGGTVATLIHPGSIVSKKCIIGEGSCVMPGAIINVGSTIGKGVIVNTSSSVDHDCRIGDWTHVAVGAHICGTVTVGNECWIGAGAVIINNLNIVAETVIGAGAAVVNNIEIPGTYMGVPARRVKE